MRNVSHLSDDRIVEIGIYGSPTSREQQHLLTCETCQAQRASLVHLLDDVSRAVIAEGDRAFPADRLARQQARILHRLDQNGRPARVIAFPADHLHDVQLRTRPANRWIAAAAVAGLVVGVLAGRLGQEGVRGVMPVQRTAMSPSPGAGRRASTAVPSDEELLGQIERAIDGGSDSLALGPLDEMTPTAWEVR